MILPQSVEAQVIGLRLSLRGRSLPIWIVAYQPAATDGLDLRPSLSRATATAPALDLSSEDRLDAREWLGASWGAMVRIGPLGFAVEVIDPDPCGRRAWCHGVIRPSRRG